MASITDSFTEPSNVNLSSHTGESGVTWTDHPHANYTTPFNVDAATDRIYSTGTAAYYASPALDSADQEIAADFYLHSAISQNIAICARMDTTDDTMYFARLNNGTSWQLFKRVNGTSTQLGSDSTNQLPSAGDFKTGKLVVRGDQVSFYVNGTLEIGPITDSAITAIGRVGVRNAGTASATTGIHLDNLSANSLNASVALFRGRNFPFFDDDEVNRFEFWPAVTTGVTEHERAATLSATGSIETSAQSFSVFERSAAVSATGGIATSAQFFTTLERSASVDSTASVTVSGTRVVDRAVSIDSTATITVSAQSFTTFEAAAAISATGAVEASAISFTVFERAVSVEATATISASSQRDIQRSVVVTANATITVSGQSFSVLERQAVLDATATIETSAQFFSTLERQAALSTTATITTTRQLELSRAVSFSTVAAISTSGGVVGGVFEFERSASLSATGEVSATAVVVSVVSRAVEISATAAITVAGLTERERAVSLAATGLIAVNHQRDLLGAVSLTATATITASGTTPTPIERSVSLSATATITVIHAIQHPTPLSRTFVLESSSRTAFIDRGNRVFVVQDEDREEAIT